LDTFLDVVLAEDSLFVIDALCLGEIWRRPYHDREQLISMFVNNTRGGGDILSLQMSNARHIFRVIDDAKIFESEAQSILALQSVAKADSDGESEEDEAKERPNTIPPSRPAAKENKFDADASLAVILHSHTALVKYLIRNHCRRKRGEIQEFEQSWLLLKEARGLHGLQHVHRKLIKL